MAAEKPLSFKSFSPKIQERFQRASDYADMFVELKNSAGVPVAAMAAYYLCRSTHGTDTPCNTIIVGKTWTRKYALDPLAKHQCWYCNICKTKYHTNFGMLIEIFNEEQVIYQRAPVKPFDIVDLAGLKFEAELSPKTPEERFAAIQESEKKVTEGVRKAVSEVFWRMCSVDLEGVYKVKEIFEKLSLFSWSDIFTFSNQNPLAGELWTNKGNLKKPIGLNDELNAHVAKFLKKA